MVCHSLGTDRELLMVALVLVRLVRQSPIIWSMSDNQLLRQLGLLLFLAEVGASAGRIW